MARQVEFDAFKGILICLIVLGHNTLFSHYYPVAFNALYNFHVASFLLLPFLFFGKSVTEYQFRDRAARYLVPHFLFFALACVAFFLLFIAKDLTSVMRWLQSVPTAILVSSEGTYRTACGFGLFWFLPALLGLVLLRTAWFRGGRGRRVALIGAALAVHLLLGFVPAALLRWLPWGLPLVLFLFPLGLLVGELWRRGINQPRYFLLSGTVFAACVYLGWRWPSSAGLAGDPQVYALDEPLHLAFHDIYLVAAFLALLLLCWRLPRFVVRALAYVGDRSLFVFLAHSFVFKALSLSGALALVDSELKPPVLSVSLSFALTLLVTLACYAGLNAWPHLYALVFPRSMAAWQGALGMSRG